MTREHLSLGWTDVAQNLARDQQPGRSVNHQICTKYLSSSTSLAFLYRPAETLKHVVLTDGICRHLDRLVDTN